MRWNGEEGDALEVVGVVVRLVIRGFLEISGESERRFRFKGASLRFLDFLSRCLWGGVESIVGFRRWIWGGFEVLLQQHGAETKKKLRPCEILAAGMECGGRVTVMHASGSFHTATWLV